MSVQEILVIAAPLLATISTLGVYIHRRTIKQYEDIVSDLRTDKDALENENKRLVAVIAVATTTEGMREELADYLRGSQSFGGYSGRRR